MMRFMVRVHHIVWDARANSLYGPSSVGRREPIAQEMTDHGS